MTKVSVVIPFCNRIEWTKEAVQSVLTQTFQDFEIIVVDDGSQKDYKEEIQKLDHRIIYLRQENKGVSAARNTGIHRSSGEFIAFLDSDDLYLPKKLEIQVSVMEQSPNILLSHTSYNQIDQEQKHLAVIGSGSFAGNVYPDIFVSCPIATPTVMLRRALLGDLKFDENVHVAEDLLLWSQISKKSMLVGIDIPLTNVRIHGKNAGIDPRKQLEGLANIVKHGLNRDPSISFQNRHMILYRIYDYSATLYVRQKRLVLGALYLLRAYKAILLVFKEHPEKARLLKRFFHTLMYKTARKILPKHVRKYITSLVTHRPAKPE